MILPDSRKPKTKNRNMKTKNSRLNLSLVSTIIALALPLTGVRAGTFISDFTKGVDTNYWGLWTSFPAGYCTNINDAQGVTFQRIAGSDRQSFDAGLGINMVNMRKITTNGFITGDFVVTMTYANLNNFVSSSGDYWTYAGNQLKLYLQWGDGGAPERVHVVQVLSFSRNYPGFQTTAFQGFVVDSQFPWQGGQLLNIQPAAPGNSATLKMARTNGVLSYYVNGQQLGVGEGDSTSAWTTNDLWSVNLMLKQSLDAAHVGVTLQSCSISGPSVKDNSPVPPPVLKLVSVASGNLGFQWDATPGRTYQVQTATNLVSNNWTDLGSSFVASNSPVAVTNAVGTDATRFFRVEAIGN